MAYQANGLTLQITGIRIYGPPARALEFEIQLFSNLSDRVVVLGSEVRVNLGDYEVARGDLLRAYSAPAKGAAFGRSNEMIGGIYVALTHETIEWIEARRVGDLGYSLNVSALVAPVIDQEPQTLGTPWLQPAENRFGSSLRDHIPLSEWLKYLTALGWDETQLFELPVGSPRQLFPAAQARFEEAVSHFRRGEWEETMSSCRKMMEALAAAKTEGGAVKPDTKKLRAFFEAGKKGDTLDSLLSEFGKLLHLARHEHPTDAPVKITRYDALLSLTLAGAFLRYVSS